MTQDAKNYVDFLARSLFLNRSIDYKECVRNIRSYAEANPSGEDVELEMMDEFMSHIFQKLIAK